MSERARLGEVVERVEAAAGRSGRRPGQVTVVAVGKGHPVEAIFRLYEAGHRDFGESRAGELEEKAARLPGDIRWHFVGPLQRNKVKRVRSVVVLLHSLDRRALAETWLKGPGRPPPVLLQVNVGGEPQKLGVDPDRAEAATAEMIDLGIDLEGLMTIPPRAERPEDARPHFARLAAVRDRLARRWPGIADLSMGMSEDFEVAVEEGATMVRVGRAIFGPRDE